MTRGKGEDRQRPNKMYQTNHMFFLEFTKVKEKVIRNILERYINDEQSILEIPATNEIHMEDQIMVLPPGVGGGVLINKV